jgi:glutathione S-transferase
MSDKPVFVYVDGRGNGERVRFVLAGAGVDYDEQNVTTKQERLDLISGGRLMTGQLPLLSIDGLDLVQSWSIIRYIARTRGLLPPPEDNANLAKVDIIAECVRDYETSSGLGGYGWSDKEEHKKKIQSAADNWFPRLEKIVQQDSFAVGTILSSFLTIRGQAILLRLCSPQCIVVHRGGFTRKFDSVSEISSTQGEAVRIATN